MSGRLVAGAVAVAALPAVAAADHDGAPSTSLCDEFDGLLAFQSADYWNYLEGYYFGFAYRELEGSRFAGAVVGWNGGEEVFVGGHHRD